MMANAHAVTQLTGRDTGFRVMVQGRHVQAVGKLLMAKGVPKKWIVAKEITLKLPPKKKSKPGGVKAKAGSGARVGQKKM